MDDAARLAMWERCLDTITTYVQDVLVKRHIFRRVGEIVMTNPRVQTPGAFHEFIATGPCRQRRAKKGTRRCVRWLCCAAPLASARLVDIESRRPAVAVAESAVVVSRPECVTRLGRRSAHDLDEVAIHPCH